MIDVDNIVRILKKHQQSLHAILLTNKRKNQQSLRDTAYKQRERGVKYNQHVWFFTN